jgi:hypothetical protein
MPGEQEDAAENTDIVLVRPREIVEFYMDEDWVQELNAIYVWPSDELLRWSRAEKYTNEILETILEIYMQAQSITKDDPVNSHNNVHNVVLQWAKGAWKAPVFKFMEATTREELVRLNLNI